MTANRADKTLPELKDELRGLLTRVPKRIINGGHQLTLQYKSDVAKAADAMSSGGRSRVIEAILAMEVWFRDATPHYHSPL